MLRHSAEGTCTNLRSKENRQAKFDRISHAVADEVDVFGDQYLDWKMVFEGISPVEYHLWNDGWLHLHATNLHRTGFLFLICGISKSLSGEIEIDLKFPMAEPSTDNLFLPLDGLVRDQIIQHLLQEAKAASPQ